MSTISKKNFYRGVLYTISSRVQYNLEKQTESTITEYTCNDKDLLHDYHVKQFVAYSEQETQDLIDYYFDEYKTYAAERLNRSKNVESFLNKENWELD